MQQYVNSLNCFELLDLLLHLGVTSADVTLSLSWYWTCYLCSHIKCWTVAICCYIIFNMPVSWTRTRTWQQWTRTRSSRTWTRTRHMLDSLQVWEEGCFCHCVQDWPVLISKC